MPDITVSPSSVSVTVSDLASSGVASGDLRGSFPSPYIDAEQFFRRGYVLASDFPNSASPWTLFTASSATTAFTHLYDGSTLNYVTLTIASATGASRVWISDRPSASVQPQFLAGSAAMIFAARVRLNRNSQTEYSCRIGFTQAHVPPDISAAKGDGQFNCINFFCAGSKTTWHVNCSANYDTVGPPPTGNSEQLNTGVSVSDWHVLRIEVNSAGTIATFYVDGTLVSTISGNSIPNPTNYPFAKSLGSWMMASSTIRATDSGTSQAVSLDVDWQYFEYRTSR